MQKTLSKEDIDIKEINSVNKHTQDQILEKKEAENKIVTNILEERLKNVSFEKLANHCNIFGNYFPYLFNFEYILNRLKGEERRDVSAESLKVKKDLTEQLNKMKKYPSLDTVCHIESVKYYSESKYWLLRHLFRNKKYKIIFHKKNVKLEKTFYEKVDSSFEIFLTLFDLMVTFMLLMVNIFIGFESTFFSILFSIGVISCILILLGWCVSALM